MKLGVGSRIRLEDQLVFVDVEELKFHTGFQATFYQYGTHEKYCKQKVMVLSKERQINVLTTWEDDWKKVVDQYWHDADILYSWEEVKKS